MIRKRKIFAKYSLYRYLDVNSFFYFSHPFIRIAWFQYRDRYRNISLLRVIIINFARFRTERKQHRARQPLSRLVRGEEEGKCVSAYVCEREREKKKIKKEKKKKKRHSHVFHVAYPLFSCCCAHGASTCKLRSELISGKR